MARSAILTPELQATIASYVNAGAPIPQACEAANVSWNTVKVWLKRGKVEEDGIYREFVDAMAKAKAAWVVGQTMHITRAGKDDWKASAWLLERRVKEFAPPRLKQELTGSLQVQSVVLLPDDGSEPKGDE